MSAIIPLAKINTPDEFKSEYPEYKTGKKFFTYDMMLYVNLAVSLPADELKSLKTARVYLDKNSRTNASTFIYFEDLDTWYFSASLSDHTLELI